MIVFYYSPGSSSLAVHIALNEIGLPFEARPVFVATRQTRQADYLAVNPEGKVPSLIVDGKLLTEVLAILFYLAEKYPESKLLPESLEDKAQALSWMSFLASTVHRSGKDEAEARAALTLAERRLGRGEWAFGTYSVVDIFLFRVFWRIGGRFKFAPGEFPALEAHQARVMTRPAVIKTLAAEKAIAESAGLILN